MLELARKGVDMRFALALIFISFISMTGQSAQATISDDILYKDLKSRHSRNHPESFDRACLTAQQIVTNDHSIAAYGTLFADCLFDARPGSAFLTRDLGGTKRSNYLDDKWAKLADTGHRAIYGRTEIETINSGNDGEMSANQSPRHSVYDKVVSWMKDAYDAWIARDQYGSTRLLLLSIGLVGLIGIRRKFKKS